MTQPVSLAASLAPAPAAGGPAQPADPRAQAFTAACAAATGTPQSGPDHSAKHAPSRPAGSAPATGQAKPDQSAGATGPATVAAADPSGAKGAGSAGGLNSSLAQMLQRPAPDAQRGATPASAMAVAPEAVTVAAAPRGSAPVPTTGKAAATAQPVPTGTVAHDPKPKAAPVPVAKMAQDAQKPATPQGADPQASQGEKPAQLRKDARHRPLVSAPATPQPQPLTMPGLAPQPHPAPQAHRIRQVTGPAAVAQTVSQMPAQGLHVAGLGASATASTAAAEATPESQAQLLQSATALAGAGGGSAKVTLHPATLGTVVVQVNVTAQGVTHVHMTAATEGGYQTLAATAGHLAQSLAHSGLNVGSVQAFVAGGSGQPGGNGAPQPGLTQPAPQGGGAAGNMAGGFAESRQQASGGQGQGQPQPQQPAPATTTGPTATARARSGPDDTVKAYA